jgi:hypothetical protein
MKRYYVIKKLSANNEHLNEQDLLPASCKLITGIAVCTTVKKEAEAVDGTKPLTFPQNLIKRILASDSVANLFYSYMRTRPSEAESKDFFETDILPGIVGQLTNGIKYLCLTNGQQSEFTQNLTDLLTGGSDQPEIDWQQRFTDLKAEYRATFLSFLEAAYAMYEIDPETLLTPQYIDSLFTPSSRSYSLYRISVEIYYALRDKGINESYSTISRNVNTNGNSILQEYDHRYEQMQKDKQAYEEAETKGLAHYLFSSIGIFEKGHNLTNLNYAQLIASETLSFIHQNKGSLFLRPVQKYQRPEPYECGSLSLLVNGNSFLLCDYILTANRKIKHLSREIIPFSEPLDVNSSIQTVYKSNLKSGIEPLNIRIYIEYEDFKEPLAEVETEKQEAAL